MIRNVVVESKPVEPTALIKIPEKLPIQHIEQTLVPTTRSNHVVVVITCA